MAGDIPWYGTGPGGERVQIKGRRILNWKWSALRHLDHSCSANAEFVGRTPVAKQPIAREEEIFHDYMATETDVRFPSSAIVDRKRSYRELESDE